MVAAIFLIQYTQLLLYTLMLSIPWSVEFNLTPTLGTDLPDEPLMLLGALTATIYLLHQRQNISIKRLHPLVIIIGLQFLWTIATVVTSTDQILSIKYALAKTWYLFAFVALPTVLFRDEKILKRSFIFLLCSMMVAMATALIRHASYGFHFSKVNDALEPFFRNHVNYSALLVFMAPILVAIIKLHSPGKIRKFLGFVLIVTFAAVYFSYARGAWMALLAGMIAYWLVRKRLLVFSFLFFMAITLASIFFLKSNDRYLNFSNDFKSTIYHKSFGEHLVATYQLKDLSNAERLYRWVAGVRMVEDNWQTGFGPSTFFYQYKGYTLPAFKTYVSDNREQSTVHNYFLLMLIEQGVIGCALFVLLIAALLWYCQKIYFRTKDKFWQTTIAAVASVLIMQCVINFLSDMIETDKVGSIFYLCVAVIIVADEKTRRATSDSSTNVEGISQSISQ